MRKIVDIANKRVEELGMDVKQYACTVKKEGKYWKVMYRLKSKRVRGGGVDVLLDEGNSKVINLVRYQ